MRFATEETYDDHCFDFYDEVGDDIGSGYVCFDFRSTNVVQLSNRNPHFYRFNVITH